MNLETLAQAVKSNFTSLQESEIIGRIMIISGRDFERSIKGYELLIAQKLLPESFVDPASKGRFMQWLNRNPNVRELFKMLDCIPGKMSDTEPQELTFVPPPRLSDAQLMERLSFSNLDF